MNYANILEFASTHKKSIIKKLRNRAVSQFMANIDNDKFDEQKELQSLKIEERALTRADELIEIILERMARGENI